MSIVKDKDKKIYDIIQSELNRQNGYLELIASENFTSKAVLETAGSVLTNKYAEGYPGKRYYGGCIHVDEAENLAIDRAKRLLRRNMQTSNLIQVHLVIWVFILLIYSLETVLWGLI